MWKSVIILCQHEKKHKNSSLPFGLSLSHPAVHRVSALGIDQTSPISRNICSAIQSNILPAPARRRLKRWRSFLTLWGTTVMVRYGPCRPSLIHHLTYSPVSQKTYITVPWLLTGRNSCQSLLRCSTWLIILILARIQFSTSFLHWRINFLPHVAR